MNFDLIFGVIILALIAIILMMRTRSGFLTLALCGGYVLAGTLNESIFNLSKSITFSLPGVTVAQLLQLIVTLIPAIIVGAHFYKSQRGISLLQQLAPTIGAVGLLIVFAQPILEQSTLRTTLDNSPLWGLFTSYRTYIIIYALAIGLFGIMLDGKSDHKPKRGRPKKHD